MMDDYGTDSTTGTEPASSFMGPSATTDSTYRTWRSALDSSAFSLEVARAPAPALPDSSAVPGELLTEAVAANIDDRRTLMRVFRKLAHEESITRTTFAALEGFLQALPRPKQLPTVALDGEGGLTLAWSVSDRGRTLITVADNVLYVVINAGSVQATYLPDIDFTGALPEELLAVIPE